LTALAHGMGEAQDLAHGVGEAQGLPHGVGQAQDLAHGVGAAFLAIWWGSTIFDSATAEGERPLVVP
jgi:hypothetical protein